MSMMGRHNYKKKVSQNIPSFLFWKLNFRIFNNQMYIKIHIRTNLFYAPLKSHEMMREQGVFKEISFPQWNRLAFITQLWYQDFIVIINSNKSPLIYIVVQWKIYRPWTLFLDMLRCGKTFFIKNYIGGIRQAADDLSFDQVLLRFPKSNIDNVP